MATNFSGSVSLSWAGQLTAISTRSPAGSGDSVVNSTLDYVGTRNSLRFPTYVRTELGLERRFKILKFQPWIGVRVWNAFSHFNPTDVQANIASPYFGGFYNSEYRQFRIQLRFER